MARAAVHVPRNGQVAVVVGLIARVAVIPMVEVVAHLAVGLQVNGSHHVLGALVNGGFIVARYDIAACRLGGEVVVHLVLPFLQAVLLCTGYCLAVKGDGRAGTGSVENLLAAIGILCAIGRCVVCEVLVALLTERQHPV